MNNFGNNSTLSSPEVNRNLFLAQEETTPSPSNSSGGREVAETFENIALALPQTNRIAPKLPKRLLVATNTPATTLHKLPIFTTRPQNSQLIQPALQGNKKIPSVLSNAENTPPNREKRHNANIFSLNSAFKPYEKSKTQQLRSPSVTARLTPLKTPPPQANFCLTPKQAAHTPSTTKNLATKVQPKEMKSQAIDPTPLTHKKPKISAISLEGAPTLPFDF